MIGDYFLNRSLLFTCTIKEIENEYSDFFVDLLFILESYDKETKRDDFSLEFKQKFDLVKHLVRRRMQTPDISIDELIDDLYVGKFKEFISYLTELSQEKINKEDIITFYNKILKRRKMYEMIFAERELTTILNDIRTENYESEDIILENYEKLLANLHDKLIENKNRQMHRQISKLSLLEDDYTPVLNKLREVSDTKRSVKTGFRLLEDRFTAGGFESDRLYLIGGESGVGKSMLLINLICNALRMNQKAPREDGKTDVLLYISAENYLHETFSRFYCCLTGTSVKSLSKRIMENDDVNIMSKIKEISKQNNCDIKFYYYEPDKTTVNDIEALIKEVTNNPNYNLKCVYIDYLDKISSGDFKGTKEKSESNRFEQGMVAKKFKLLANKYSIPIVTCTQLNRSGYNVDSNPDLTQMGESMIKINESDVVIFLQNVSDPLYNINTKYGICQYKKIRMTLLKNRNGAISEPKLVVVKQQINDQNCFNFRILEIDENGNELYCGEMIKENNLQKDIFEDLSISGDYDQFEIKKDTAIYYDGDDELRIEENENLEINLTKEVKIRDPDDYDSGNVPF